MEPPHPRAPRGPRDLLALYDRQVRREARPEGPGCRVEHVG
ncbi:GNAT family N-acetyltransferase, partial [Streptomyces sp. SID2131]|nr:GNAT family N-acetyltransferase [Streptomyces sp. SID2131]